MSAWLGRWFGEDTSEVPAEPIPLAKVFTPSTPADGSYVSRPNEERDLRAALRAPGTQVVVYGESGAGKTSMSVRVLAEMERRHVVTRCDPSTTYESLLTSVFHQLGVSVKSSSTSSDTVTLSASGGVPLVISSDAEWAKDEQVTFTPLVGAPVNAESLVKYLGAKKSAWVIEDFHKTSVETKASLSHALKIFADFGGTYPETQVIVLGAAETAEEVWGTHDSNVASRMAAISVPPLTDAQLGAVLDKGAQLLNLDLTAVREEIIRHSVGVAGVTHGLAFGCCDAANVTETQPERLVIDPDILDQAKENYSRTRQFGIKVAFDKALAVKATRTYDNHSIIVHALASLGESGGTHAEILAQIRKRYPEYPSGNLTIYLRELQKPDRGEVVRKTSSGHFRFQKPLMHTYARQLFNIKSSGAVFWTGFEVRFLEQLRKTTNELLPAPGKEIAPVAEVDD